MIGKLIAPEVQELLEARDFATLRNSLEHLPAADVAEILGDLDAHEDMVVLFRLLTKNQATDVFEHLDFPQQESLLRNLKSDRVGAILEAMAPDDRTAFLEELPPKAASKFLSLLSPAERHVATRLLTYPEESVGRLMTPDFIYLRPQMSVGLALEKVRHLGIDRETVYELYVIDGARTLAGRISLRRLVTSPLEAIVGDLMKEDVSFVIADQDREDAVELIKRYDLLALPVTDREGKLIGIVTWDDLIDVIEQEYTEDAQMQAAVIPDDVGYLNQTVGSLVRRRIVWLIFLLGAEMVGVMFLRRYGTTLDNFIALAFFLPVMIATGGNTGTQSAALVIRAIATGEVQLRNGVKVLARDFVVGLILAVSLGLLAGLLSWAMDGQPRIGLCVGAGLATIVVLSNLAGTMLPLIFERMKMDPALMSGPFISTLVDVFGLVIYLEISLLVLGSGPVPGG